MKAFNPILKLPTAIAISGLVLAATPAFAQDVQPVYAPPPPIVAPEPVITQAPTATPARPSDTIAPEAQEAVKQAEKPAPKPTARSTAAPSNRTAAAAPVTVSPADTADAGLTEESSAAITGMPGVSTADAQLIPPAEEPVVVEEAGPTNGMTDDTLLIALGLAGALGVAGVGTAMVRRRRKDPVNVNRAPAQQLVTPAPIPVTQTVAAPLVAEPAAAPVYARPAPAIAEPTIRQPVFAAQAARGEVTDPMFTPTIAIPPVTDPLFMRKVDLPPVTDPLFSRHPDYVGAGARQATTGWNRPMAPAGNATGIPLAEVGKPVRELEPAE